MDRDRDEQLAKHISALQGGIIMQSETARLVSFRSLCVNRDISLTFADELGQFIGRWIAKDTTDIDRPEHLRAFLVGILKATEEAGIGEQVADEIGAWASWAYNMVLENPRARAERENG